MRYIDLRPDHTRRVAVLVDGVWREGWLEACRQDDDGRWFGWARWSEGVGMLHIGWFGGDALRSGSDDAAERRDDPRGDVH